MLLHKISLHNNDGPYLMAGHSPIIFFKDVFFKNKRLNLRCFLKIEVGCYINWGGLKNRRLEVFWPLIFAQ